MEEIINKKTTPQKRREAMPTDQLVDGQPLVRGQMKYE